MKLKSYRWKMIGVVLATARTLASSDCFANVPGGGSGNGPDVSVKNEGNSIVPFGV